MIWSVKFVRRCLRSVLKFHLVLIFCCGWTRRVCANPGWEVGVLAVSHRQPLPSEFSVSAGIRSPPPHQHPVLLPDWCKESRGFSALEAGICSMDPVVATAAVKGYKMALKYCTAEFAYEKWNCSLARNIWEAKSHSKNISKFDDDVLPSGLRDTKEAAFYYALTRAGISHSITEACTKQQMEGCRIGPDGFAQDNLLRAIRKSKNLIIPLLNQVVSRGWIVKKAIAEEWQWGNASHNIEHGIKYSKKQLENGFNAKQANRLPTSDRLNLHNTNVGRRVYEKAVLLVCKCHGMSGSCATRTCWRRQADFRKVARELKNIYFAAKRVSKPKSGSGNTDRYLYYGAKRRRKLSKGQLAFTRKTPNLCQRNHRFGIQGTRGRSCDNISESACQRLCCGRGYNTHLVRVQTKCGCEFSWCCDVTCSTCEQLQVLRICKR